MKTLLFYLLQVIVTSGILYGYYHFALRNKRFHKYNRFYLLAATVVSMAVPFLNIPVYFTQSDADSSFVLQTLTVFSAAGSDNSTVFATSAESHSNWFTWQNLSWLIYMLIAFIVLLRIIFSLLKIRRIVKNNPAEKLDTIRFVNTTEPGTPFSFFRWLFWNKKIELHSEKGEQIFRHELFHIEQKHSRDTIYMELLTVVFWINPFFYLMKNELKAIHEFLADQFAVSKNTKWQYAELLLMQALNTNHHLVNPFFHNQIKRRIAMITTSKKPSHQYLRKLMVLPVAAIVMGLFAFSYKKKQEENLKQSLDVVDNIKTGAYTSNKLSVDGADQVKINSGELNINTGAPKDTTNKPLIVLDGEKHEYNDGILKDLDPGLIERVNVLKGPSAILKYGEWGKNGVIEIITKKKNKEDTKENSFSNKEANDSTISIFNKEIIISNKTGITSSFPGGDKNWRQYQYLAQNLNSSISKSNNAPDGYYTVVIIFIVLADGSVSDIRALTNHGFGLETEAIRVIKSGPKWVPEMRNNKNVNAIIKQPITFVVETVQNKPYINPEGFTLNIESSGNELRNVATTSLRPDSSKIKNRLLVVDGKIIQLPKNNMEKINITGLVRMTLLDEKTAIKKYGEKGKNGAYEMYTAKSNPGDYKKDTTRPGFAVVYPIFDNPEIPPSFPGGTSAWQKYLSNNLNSSIAIDSGAAPGTYKIWIQFIVDENGNISDLRPITSYGHGMENEVMRIISKVPKWVPAVQNGRKVRAYLQQPVTFQITEENDQVNTNNNILNNVDIPPSFPGGEIAFEKYIRLNQKKVKIPAQNPKATKGLRNISISLPVSFTINTDGAVSDIKTSSTDKVGLGDHAIELIKTGPRWIPAFQNGKPIKATKQQLVKFAAEIDKSTSNSKSKKTQEVIYYTIRRTTPSDN